MLTKDTPGIRTRVLLLASLVLVIAGSTAASLLIIRSRLQQHAQEAFSADLYRSVELFQKLQTQKLVNLRRANALIADLPSLKALMTTRHQETVADGSVPFWKVSGNDLFALADRDGNILALNTRRPSAQLLPALRQKFSDPSQHLLLAGSDLYEYTTTPIYFGDPASGTLLGYVISGYAIDDELMQDVASSAGSDAAVFHGSQLIASSLPDARVTRISADLHTIIGASVPVSAVLNGERYLAITKNFEANEITPIRLVMLKSFAQTDAAEKQINRLVALAGAIALAGGTILMLLLSRMLTSPIERLTSGVRAFGTGNDTYVLPSNGTQEVRFLSKTFAQMREQIQTTNSKLLESERLATIGRMAASISHDLRHYLAAVYANAEFLASPNLSEPERNELYEEIRLAVQGTTEMLDSLLIFGRTGNALLRTTASVEVLAERAITLVKSHPDSDGVAVTFINNAADTTAAVDGRQIERALYNLLLNACQSARQSPTTRSVSLTLTATPKTISASIVDSGPGVSESIRDNLFAPFVSEGRHKGTGLGLTLAWTVAREHEGDVRLVDGRAGSTTFVFTISRTLHSGDGTSHLRDGVLTQ
ncbi:ATP-binding protein [Terriglobus albidus]|uniref:ATP-binding protein n=1 Tax=Terriglobus albidus TaxID=1592106 RepID=UPI0021E015DF|nr:ATP-binding protein [Terriglobus albidus]